MPNGVINEEFAEATIRNSAGDLPPGLSWVNPPHGWVAQLKSSGNFHVETTGGVQKDGTVDLTSERHFYAVIRNRVRGAIAAVQFEFKLNATSGQVVPAISFVAKEEDFPAMKKILAKYGISDSVGIRANLVSWPFLDPACQQYFDAVSAEKYEDGKGFVPTITIGGLRELCSRYLGDTLVAIAEKLEAVITPEFLAKTPREQELILRNTPFPDKTIIPGEPVRGVDMQHKFAQPNGLALA